MRYILLFLVTAPIYSWAGELRLFCRGEGCADRVVSTLEKAGCLIDHQTLRCETWDDKTMNLCGVSTQNCSEPRPDMMFTTKCISSNKVSLKKYDAGLSLTWWMGWGPYMHQICVAR